MATVYASEDTYSLSDEDSPHGSVSVLAVIDNATRIAHTYIKFDLSGWAGKTLEEGLIKLRIASNEIPSGQHTRIRFRRITETWDESTLKWSNAPAITTTNGKSKSIYSTASGWETYNITELIQDIIDDESCCGVYVEIDDHVVWFSSSEGSYTPKLSLTEAVSHGDILRGASYPSSQTPGERMDMVVDIKNKGSVGGYFVLSYYEGSTHLHTASRAWVSAGQTITDISERFTMPDRDFVVTVRIHNESTEEVDDTYNITCYLVAEVPLGDILSGDVQPASQVAGSTVDVAVNIKNVGSGRGHFTLYYYEGSTHLRTESAGWLNAGQTISDIAEIFNMPDRDFTVTVRLFNDTTEEVDDTYNIMCYLIGGTDYYVKTNGNDELPGSSWAMAWATIDKAARTVPDGATVHIGFGDYNNEPAGNKIAPQNTGAEGIWYMPETANSEGGTGTVTIEKNA